MKRLAALAAFLASTGCGGHQSAFAAAGQGSRTIHHLLWLFFAILGVVFLIVVAIALISLTRRRRGIEQEPLEGGHQPSEETERGLARIVGGATALTLLILLGLIVVSVSAGRAISDRAMPAHYSCGDAPEQSG
jgi:cytochrome c oxidase subunit 2